MLKLNTKAKNNTKHHHNFTATVCLLSAVGLSACGTGMETDGAQNVPPGLGAATSAEADIQTSNADENTQIAATASALNPSATNTSTPSLVGTNSPVVPSEPSGNTGEPNDSTGNSTDPTEQTSSGNSDNNISNPEPNQPSEPATEPAQAGPAANSEPTSSSPPEPSSNSDTPQTDNPQTSDSDTEDATGSSPTTTSETDSSNADTALASCTFPTSAATLQPHWIESDTGQAVPEYKVSVPEPSSNTTLTRISSNAVFGTSNGSAVHLYSKRQAWNADQTLIDIGGRTINASTFDIVNGYIPITNERNWSNVDPNVVIGVRYNPEANELVAANVVTGAVDVKHRFEGFNSCTLGDFEGNVSSGDKRALLACTNASTSQRTLISYDIETDTIIGTMDAAWNFNWGGFSDSGDYIVVENSTYPSNGNVLIRYLPDFSNPLPLGSPAHGDFGVDDNGDEIYAMIHWDHIYYYRLHDGAYVELSISDNSNPIGHGHLSCRNSARPGWCYFSAYHERRLGAVKMSATNSEVEFWGFHRSNSLEYAATPKASSSRLGDKIIFTSQWYGRGETVDYTMDCQPN